MHFQTIYVPGFLKQFYTYHDFPRLFLLKSKKISNGHRSKMSFIVEVAVSTPVIGHTNIELPYKFFSNCSIKKYATFFYNAKYKVFAEVVIEIR